MRDDKTLFLFVFRDEYLENMNPSSEREYKSVLARIFADVDWECPQILKSMEKVRDVYYDRVSQIRMDRWTKGRTALIGDAAACVSLLAGEGTGLAMAEAYVLAGELKDCGGDHIAAFARYEKRMRPFLKRKQEAAANFASSFVPKSALGITMRNLVTRLLRIPFVADFFIGRGLRDDIELPAYGFSKMDAVSPSCSCTVLRAIIGHGNHSALPSQGGTGRSYTADVTIGRTSRSPRGKTIPWSRRSMTFRKFFVHLTRHWPTSWGIPTVPLLV
jgi:hypothetical protein